MKRLYNVLILFLCLIMAGCGRIKIDWVDNTDEVGDDYVSAVAESLDGTSKEDCVMLYQVYRGGAMYVDKNADRMNTSDFESLLQKVLKQHGWLSDNLESKDKDFSKVVYERLASEGLADPKSLSEVEEKVENILNETAEGAIKASKDR